MTTRRLLLLPVMMMMMMMMVIIAVVDSTVLQPVDYDAINYYNGDYSDDQTSFIDDYAQPAAYDDDRYYNDADYDAQDDDAKSSGTRYVNKKRVFVPVLVPETQKKKMKIISVDKGFYIPGGTQLFGKFKSLRSCMKACALAPTCFSADYNPWLHKCYQHSNHTACNTRKSHPQFVHFGKVPCTIIDAPAGQVTLGASVANGLHQKGIETITECIKKCVNAEGGIPPVVRTGLPHSADVFYRQGCFAIDYDFATHKCFFFATNVWTELITTTAPTTTVTPYQYHQIFLHCPITPATRFPSINTIPNPTVVHITFCPLPV